MVPVSIYAYNNFQESFDRECNLYYIRVAQAMMYKSLVCTMDIYV